MDTTGTSATFSLSGLTANASYDLQASLDSTFMDGTEVSGGFTNRPAHEDFDSLHSNNTTASGLWGNSTTLYVGQYDDRLDSGFYTYNRSSHAFESTTTLRDISGFEHVSELPNGLWSDGTYLWMVVDDGSVEALALADNSHAAGQYFRTDYSSKTSGIWGNSSTIWVSRNAKDGHLLPAHRKDTKVADTDKNITLHADNIDVRAIWSDGTTMWVVDEDDLKAYAYGMDDGMRDEDPEFDLDPENESPQGMWSDGDTVWVSDSGADRIYAYYLPGGGEPRVSDVGAVSASRQTATATVKLLNPGSASTTVSLRYRLTADTDWTDADAPVDATGTSANFSLSGLTANAEYDLQASLDSTFMDGAEISGGFTNRPLDEDFDTLWASGNAFPTGIWSDGTTMWVSDKSDDSFYAYTLTTKQFTKKLDVSPATLLSGRTTTTPHQIWSNGTYLWMLDSFQEEIFAMDIANESDAGEYDISTGTLVTVGNDRVAGIWGSVDTSGMTATGIMYVADDQDDKIYAYDLSGTTWSSSTSSSFFTTLSAAGNNNPRGIWSDGATMWVIDDNDDKIYAYNASTKARDAAKDLALVTKTGESSFDMWSDGDILWVSNARLVEGLIVGSHVRLYAYYLPGAGEPRVTGVSVDTASVTKNSATVRVTLNNPDSDSQTVYQRHWAKSGSPPASASDQKITTSDSVTFNLSSLSQGVEYQVDASLDSTFMTGVVSHTFITLDVAGKPTGVTVTEDDKKLTVAWTAPTDTGGTAITGFKVQWKSGNQNFGGDPSRQHTAGAADTSHDITGLTNGTEYTVRVLATNSVGDGAWSDEKNGTPSTVPGKPVVTPSAGNTEINVSWTIDTGGSAITGYTLQYKESSVAGWAAADVTEVNPANDQTSYKIENLTNGTAYTVRLQATNANGTGAWSDEKSETPTAKPPPSVTIATEADEPIQGPFTFTVTFNEEVEDFYCYADEPENPPDGPLCEIGAGYVGGALVDVKDFEEVAVNSAGEHVFSARVEDILTGTLAISVNPGKAHAKAGGLGNTFGTLQVEVELLDRGTRHPITTVWSSQMTPASIGGYLGYGSVGSHTGGSLTDDEFNWQGQTYTVKALLYNPAQGQLELDLSPALPDQGHRMVLEFYYLDTQQRYHASLEDPRESGLIQDDEQLWTYHWHPAETELEAGGLVVVKLERQGPGGPPPPPTGLSATPVPAAIALSWDGPPSGVSVTGYRVERRNREGGEYAVVIDDTGSAGAGYTDSTATSDGKYYYRVTALNSAGESRPSYPVSAGPPGQPQSASALGTREDALLSWDDPQDDSITGYHIERRDRDQGGGFSTLESDTGGADTGYSDDTVEPGGRYAYRVTALNDFGESDPSEPVEVDIPGGLPDRPTGLDATATEDAVTLSWDGPGNDGITGYRIERQDREGSDGFATLVADTGSADAGYTDDTVEAGGRYAYRVAAINGDGESQASEPANADVPGGNPPDQPTGLGAVASEDAVDPVLGRSAGRQHHRLPD